MSQQVETSTSRILKRAPLPFQGQKSKWFAQFSQVLDRVEQKAQQLNRPVCAIDVFGGSGLLSHWTKRLHPDFTVIYNDFDNYEDRIKHVHDVNLLMDEVHKLLPEYDRTMINKKLTPPQADKFRQLITDYKERLDIYCLSAWFNFTGNISRSVDEFLKGYYYYYRLPANNYNEEDVNHYLDGITVIHEDANDYNKFQQKIKSFIPPNALVFYILDPPYLYCDKTGYNTAYFRLESTIDLINYFIHEDYFIMFNSFKSGFTELLHKINKLFPIVREEYERIDKTRSSSYKVPNDEYALIRIT